MLAPGFSGDKHDLTVQLTRIMFPGIGFLVLSAWCLGVLNSHRQFFLSYVAPVLWNVAQIAALVVGVIVVGGHETLAEREDLAIYLAWGVLIGGVLQFGVQIGPVRRLLGGIRLSLDTDQRVGAQRPRPVRPGAAGPRRHPDHGVGRPAARQLPGDRRHRRRSPTRWCCTCCPSACSG